MKNGFNQVGECQEWWLNGNHHREDGPALIWPDGHQEWWLNGERHRIDGPALIRPGYRQQWYFKGTFLGYNDKGFWALWDLLTSEQRDDLILLNPIPRI